MALNFWEKFLTLFKVDDKPESKGELMNQTTEKQGVEATPVTKEPAPQKHKVTEEDVCDQVMAKLGRPPKFHRCTAAHMPDSRNYRVNVWNKGEMGSGVITDSFFAKVNEEGVIVSPEIKRKYPSIHKA